MAFTSFGNMGAEELSSMRGTPAEREMYCTTVNLGTWPMNMPDGEWISLPIQWQVMRRTESETMLISRYVLDCRPYRGLKKWLKEQFVPRAFTEEEQGLLWGSEKARIPQTMFFSERCLQLNPGILHGEASKYAVMQGVSLSRFLRTTPNAACGGSAFGPCWWWLGDQSGSEALVMNPDRTESSCAADTDDIGVRTCIILEDSVYDGMEKTPFISGYVTDAVKRYNEG